MSEVKQWCRICNPRIYASDGKPVELDRCDEHKSSPDPLVAIAESLERLADLAEVDVIEAVLREVAHERIKQLDKWGQQDCTDFEWISILTEEVGEAAKEANDFNFKKIDDPTALPRLRKELIQIAAVAVAHVEAIDRRIKG